MTVPELVADVVVDRAAGFRLVALVTAHPGETVAVMGPSGAGKSTLLAALAGLVPLDDGAVTLGGKVLSSPTVQVAAARRGTVLLGQDPRLFPHLTARENVAFGPRAGGVPADAARRHADEWLARVGLAEESGRRPAALSGGQQQRVAVARALAASPRLLLLDEPFTSLDPVTVDGIRTMLAPHLEGLTVIVVTHDAVDAVALADRVIAIEDGAVSQSGPVRDVLGAPATAFVASLAGMNRVVGTAVGGTCLAGDVALAGVHAEPVPDGAPVAAVFRPSDVELVGPDEAGSESVASAGGQRGTVWRATVIRLEQTVGGVRVHTNAPSVVVDLPIDVVAARGIRPGDDIVLAVPADAVRLLST